ncbi:hypothetical protein B0H14DRAFT_3441888 [Mycena olivaceomarginata]|nr:hypothetical protein B0H14DRAFT_3441888 [Mycena olivaceomarginata]
MGRPGLRGCAHPIQYSFAAAQTHPVKPIRSVRRDGATAAGDPEEKGERKDGRRRRAENACTGHTALLSVYSAAQDERYRTVFAFGQAALLRTSVAALWGGGGWTRGRQEEGVERESRCFFGDLSRVRTKAKAGEGANNAWNGSRGGHGGKQQLRVVGGGLCAAWWTRRANAVPAHASVPDLPRAHHWCLIAGRSVIDATPPFANT